MVAYRLTPAAHVYLAAMAKQDPNEDQAKMEEADSVRGDRITGGSSKSQRGRGGPGRAGMGRGAGCF